MEAGIEEIARRYDFPDEVQQAKIRAESAEPFAVYGPVRELHDVVVVRNNDDLMKSNEELLKESIAKHVAEGIDASRAVYKDSSFYRAMDWLGISSPHKLAQRYIRKCVNALKKRRKKKRVLCPAKVKIDLEKVIVSCEATLFAAEQVGNFIVDAESYAKLRTTEDMDDYICRINARVAALKSRRKDLKKEGEMLADALIWYHEEVSRGKNCLSMEMSYLGSTKRDIAALKDKIAAKDKDKDEEHSPHAEPGSGQDLPYDKVLMKKKLEVAESIEDCVEKKIELFSESLEIRRLFESLYERRFNSLYDKVAACEGWAGLYSEIAMNLKFQRVDAVNSAEIAAAKKSLKKAEKAWGIAEKAMNFCRYLGLSTPQRTEARKQKAREYLFAFLEDECSRAEKEISHHEDYLHISGEWIAQYVKVLKGKHGLLDEEEEYRKELASNGSHDEGAAQMIKEVDARMWLLSDQISTISERYRELTFSKELTTHKQKLCSERARFYQKAMEQLRQAA